MVQERAKRARGLLRPATDPLTIACLRGRGRSEGTEQAETGRAQPREEERPTWLVGPKAEDGTEVGTERAGVLCWASDLDEVYASPRATCDLDLPIYQDH